MVFHDFPSLTELNGHKNIFLKKYRRYRKILFSFLFVISIIIFSGCYSTVVVTDLHSLHGKSIEIVNKDKGRYYLSIYVITDSSMTLSGEGYIFKDNERKEFHGTVSINDSTVISFRKFDVTNTALLLIPWIIIGSLQF
jgi:hypothetical protein